MSEALAVYHGRFGRACLYRLDRPMPVHVHREAHLALHVRGHSCGITVSQKPQRVCAKNVICINSWEPHNFEVSDPNAGHLVLILYIDPGWFVRYSGSEIHFGHTAIEASPLILNGAQRIVALMRKSTPVDRFDGALFDLIAECVETSQVPGRSPVAGNMQAVDTRISRSLELMTTTFRSEALVYDVAKDVGLSRPHFFELFRKQTGITPNQFRNTLRMEYAIELLTNSDQNVTKIGLNLGFSSPSSFSRFFSAYVGVAPTMYREVVRWVSQDK
ncbi:MAG: AraC family transcriptional regulator [Gammaproteobacteria bacterium]|nr:AraC family transcriptional regulator [Gammaproteobacteria bacterium]